MALAAPQEQAASGPNADAEADPWYGYYGYGGHWGGYRGYYGRPYGYGKLSKIICQKFKKKSIKISISISKFLSGYYGKRSADESAPAESGPNANAEADPWYGYYGYGGHWGGYRGYYRPYGYYGKLSGVFF